MPDTSVDNVISFEGPEKCLEVWFIDPREHEDDTDAVAPPSPDGCTEPRYLLTVSKERWEEMLVLVNCLILSEISTPNARAYLLSESSLFIYDTQLVIKTCGTTTLLNCLPTLLNIASEVGLVKVDNVFYNRQSFFFPDKQLEPHQSFKAECRTLDSYFRNGGAYVVGRVNGRENHYNFYNAECRMSRDDPAMQERDSTLEILMTGLDPTAMKHFYHQEGVSNAEIRARTGIADFFPTALIDDFMFEPFGYSLNGLTDEGYFTIHITPQDHCSFVSFETNVYMEDYTELISKVLNCFRPSRFILVHLANSLVVSDLNQQDKGKGFDVSAIVNPSYQVCDDIKCHFDHYNMQFMQMQRISPHPKPVVNRRRLDDDGSILKSDSPFITAGRTSLPALPNLSLAGEPSS